MKTPAAPSKTSKRGSNLFKGKGATLTGTAPNTPEEDGKAGITVMADEYDPSQDVAALTNGNVPSSPLRKDVKSTEVVEEKKESEDATATAGTPPLSAAAATGTGVDVVSKILSNFDDICAVPKDPKQTHPAASSIASSKSGKKEAFTHPEWGREPSIDGDETTTNPSISLPSESSEHYSSAYTDSTSMMMGPDHRRGVIKKSPSQDHENFEVVLDPTSLLSDDDEEPGTPKQRRWPFASASSSKHNSKQNKPSEPKKAAPAVPPPIIEEDNAEETPDPQIPDVSNLPKAEEDTGPTEDKDDGAVDAVKKSTAKKSLVRRSWKSCKKLIAKASGTGKEPKEQHFAEVDNEAQNVVSEEQKETAVDEGSQQQKNDVDPTVDEVNENEVEYASVEDTDKLPNSTTNNVWNSFVASIAGTFDPEVAAVNNVIEQVKEDGTELVEKDTPPLGIDEKSAEVPQGGLPVEVTAGPERKEKSKARASKGWKKLKNFVKSSKKESKKDLVASDAPSEKPVPAKADTEASNDVEQIPLRKPKALWKAVEDKGTGKTYYYHRKTRETTWNKPKEYHQYEIDLQKWKAAQESQEKLSSTPGDENTESAAAKENFAIEKELSDRPSSPRVASWPSSAPKSDAEDKKEGAEIRRTATPPARTAQAERDASATSSNQTMQSKSAKSTAEATSDGKDKKNWEHRKEVERLLSSLPPDNSRKTADELMTEYSGREHVLLKQLRAKVESQPVEEALPFDEPMDVEERRRSAAPRSPHRFGQRTMTYMSKASATTRSSALTDRTEKIKNTGKGKLSPFVPINETLSSATSISSHSKEDKYLGSMPASPARGRVPSRVPVPRERQLMVEELTDSRISAESYEGNGGKRGRIVRGRAREPVQTHLDTVYDGDNDDNTEDDNTASLYDNDTYGTDSVSALSENDTDFIHRKDNFEQARRRALDDAIEREDWDLAAALSEGMRAANMPGGYERAHTSWNQSELDKFIANNDWSAVKNYIARMREKSQSSTNKSIGARSQLQHKELMSESSWTSDSASSYESYDSESEI